MALPEADDIEDLTSPSNVIKLGYELKRLCNIKSGVAIRQRDITTRDECRDFITLTTSEWGLRVNKLSRTILHNRRYGIEERLALPSDLVKLANELSKFDRSIISSTNFRHGEVIVMTKFLTYNRRS